MGQKNETVKTTDRSIVYESVSMGDLLVFVKRVARTRASVILHGESGTGKELIAHAIHQFSPRSNRRFVAINCAAIPETLMENELFGHKKGSFTGAKETTRGRFERADGGTLFLDEIGEMPLALQPKLLRVLQEGEIERLGGDEPIGVDVRIVCATNKDLKACAAAGTFRQDLFYRLNVFSIHVPPLRERHKDILPLINHFIEKHNVKEGFQTQGTTLQFKEFLCRYGFPGNVRELENIMIHTMIKASGPLLDVKDLPEYLIGEMDDSINTISNATDESKILEEKLKGILHKGKPWHFTLRCISIEEIRAFLEEHGGAWFSRKQFNEFLQNGAEATRNTYKTAGVFLTILKENGILVHNGEKANRSRYKSV